MTLRRRALAALAMTFLLVAAPVGTASAASVNWSADQSPEIYKHEDVLTVAKHDRADMSSPLEYEADDGSQTSLPAHLNSTQDTPVGVRLDKIEADRYQLFPRVSGEDENGETWLNTSNWTKASGSSSSMTISDGDGATASGVPGVTFDASVASTETAEGNFSQGVDITSDADKRVLLFVGDVTTLASGSNVTIEAHDGDGDFRYASINESGNVSQDHVIVNSTTSGVFFQERLSNLKMGGSGDGTLDSIKYIKIKAHEANAKVNVVGLDFESKTVVDVGETMEDTDGDDNLEANTVDNFTDGGEINLTSLDSMGGMFDSAVIHDLKVYNVRYGISDLDSSDYRAEFGNATDYAGYDHDLTIEAPLRVPTAIDLTHGSLEIRGDQQFVSERYATLDVAEDVDKDDTHDEVNSTHYTDKSDQFSKKDETHTILGSGVTAGSTDWIQLTINLLDGEYDALAKDESAALAPTDDSSGGLIAGFVNFITEPITVFVGTILGLLGLGKKASG